MDIMIFKDCEAVAEAGAQVVRNLLAEKPAAVLGMATGNTPIRMYKKLIADCENKTLSFKDVTTFNLDEYHGISPRDPKSYRAYMQKELFDHIDIDSSNTHLPACAKGEDHRVLSHQYEALIEAKGGIDLQILGLGQNGHIGFNEPTSSLGSRTRIKTLTRGTLNDNRQYFDDDDAQPHLAITMGIATILEARRIMLLATGEGKADAVRQFVEGPVSAICPASALQFHNDVIVLLDEPAASSLAYRGYYERVREQKIYLADQLKEG
ncbi:MAG: glucosamine-6-phosphate deaminase [Gammaproteobacteria bacterium]|nr:glucosamine-6-phosphate deaminase [Gammaproteobacteria bacterium]